MAGIALKYVEVGMQLFRPAVNDVGMNLVSKGSPIYGFPGRISSLTQALLLLGMNVARGLLLGVSVLESRRN